MPVAPDTPCVRCASSLYRGQSLSRQHAFVCLGAGKLCGTWLALFDCAALVRSLKQVFVVMLCTLDPPHLWSVAFLYRGRSHPNAITHTHLHTNLMFVSQDRAVMPPKWSDTRTPPRPRTFGRSHFQVDTFPCRCRLASTCTGTRNAAWHILKKNLARCPFGRQAVILRVYGRFSSHQKHS